MKIQRGDERLLSTHEKNQVKRFLRSRDILDDNEVGEEEKLENSDFASDIVRTSLSRKRMRISNNAGSSYKCTNHINPTTNVCERLFSKARLIMSHLRKSMSPYHLELLLFLKVNRHLWNVSTVQDCLDNPVEIDDVNQIVL